MVPSNTTTTLTGRAILKFLPRLFNDVLLSTEAEKQNQDIPEIMQVLSQAAGNLKAHFTIMTGEKCLTYLFKVQVSKDSILIQSARLALGNFRN